MKIFINIFISFTLLYWPILLMTSVMLFDAPGSTHSWQPIVIALIICSLPTLIGLLSFYLNHRFWGLEPKTFLISTLAASIFASFLFGYPKLLINVSKGISSDGYFVKENKVYYNGNIIDASADQFEVFDKPSIFARDSKSIFYYGKKIEKADAKTFQKVNQFSSYYKDKNHVFFNNQLIDGSDPSTFENIYFYNKKIPKDLGSDKLIFEDQISPFYKDKNSVFYYGKKLPDLDLEKVQVLNTQYIKDDKIVYFQDHKINDADAQTFIVLKDEIYWAKDLNSIYYQSTRFPELDPESVEFLDRNYIKDKNKVYYLKLSKQVHELKPLTEAESKKFTVTQWDSRTQSEANDGTHFYSEGQLVK